MYIPKGGGKSEGVILYFLPGRVAQPKQPTEMGVFDAPNLQTLGVVPKFQLSLLV